MTARRLMIMAGTATIALALSQGAALAYGRHYHHAYYHHAYYHHAYYHHAYYRHVYYHHVYYRHAYYPRYAGYYGRESAYVEYPYGGPRVIESSPVPDTPLNRDRFGGPMSVSGRMTAPIGN